MTGHINITWQEQVEKTAHKTRRGNDKKFKEWMMGKEHLTYMFDYYLWAHCYSNVLKLQHNYDNCWVITGMERQGKSTLALEICSVISPTFKKENICYTMRDIIIQARNSKPGDSILIDEGAVTLLSRNANRTDNKTLIEVFTMFGMKNINVVICIPNFFLLDKYIREHRVSTLILVTERGKYRAYVKDAIQKISEANKKNKKILDVKISDGSFWRGYFNKGFPGINDLNESEYLKWKEENINKRMDSIIKKPEEKPKEYLTTTEAGKELGVTRYTIWEHAKAGHFNCVKSGNHQGALRVEKDSFMRWKDSLTMPKRDEIA